MDEASGFVPERVSPRLEFREQEAAAGVGSRRTAGAILAVRQGVTMALAVALALRRLRRDKLVQVDTKGRITLTATGRAIADRLRLRHHLVERLLHEVLGMEWYLVHEEAERIEHSVSEIFERKLIEKLGPSGPCPHGNLINKSVAERRSRGLQQLGEAAPGTSVRVDSMYERDRQLLEYFDQLGIRPGVPLKVLGRNYDGTVSLELGGRATNLGEAAARKIWVSAAAPVKPK